MPLKILIVAEPGLVCLGLQDELAEDPELALCGLADNELKALDLTYQLAPDVVLVDLKLAEAEDFKLIEALSQAWPFLYLIVFSASHEKARLAKALESGASGYLGEKLNATQLCQTLKAVARGGPGRSTVREEETSLKAPTQEQAPRRGRAVAEDGEQNLRPQELEIVQLLAEGKTNLAIRQRLGLSETQLKSCLGYLTDPNSDLLSSRDRC